MLQSKISVLFTISILASCGGGGGGSSTVPETPTPPAASATTGTASVSGTTYTITSGSTVISANQAYTINGGPGFNGGSINGQTGTFMALPNGSNLVAIATNPSQSYAGISGTTSAPTTNTGLVTYSGRFIASSGATSSANGAITLNTNFTAGTVSTSTGGLNVTGIIAGNTLTGTAVWNGNSAPITGGFYNGNQLNAAGTNGSGYSFGFATTAP